MSSAKDMIIVLVECVLVMIVEGIIPAEWELRAFVNCCNEIGDTLERENCKDS